MSAPVDGPDVVDFYAELGLGRDQSVTEIREALEQQKPEWQSKRFRAGAVGDQARRQLGLIAVAESVFSDETSRLQYDSALAGEPEPEPEPQIDWLARAWDYYWREDYGAAARAAQKSRMQLPNDPRPYVISAWVNLAQGHFERAVEDADEAYVLDTVEGGTPEVLMIRGHMFYERRLFQQASQCFEQVLGNGTGPIRAKALLRRSWASAQRGNMQKSFDSAVQGLVVLSELDSPFVGLATNLTNAALYAFDSMVDRDSPTERGLSEARKLRGNLPLSNISEGPRRALETHLDARIRELNELIELDHGVGSALEELQERSRAAYERHPGSDRADFPGYHLFFGLLALALAALGLLGGPYNFFTGVEGAEGLIILGLIAAVVCFFVLRIGLRNLRDWAEWGAQYRRHRAGERTRAVLAPQINRLRRDFDDRRRAIQAGAAPKVSGPPAPRTGR